MEKDSNNANHWEVDNLDHFLHYFCPDCEAKYQDKETFLSHAQNHHPSSLKFLQKFTENLLVCTICTQKGHEKQNCPKSKICGKCGEDGHVTVDCKITSICEDSDDEIQVIIPPPKPAPIGNKNKMMSF